MKRAFFLFLVFGAFVLTLLSCSKSENDPLAVASFFDKKDYEVKIFVDNEDLRYFAADFEISHSGISCIISVVPDNGNDYYKSGIFIYFDSTDVSEKTAQDLEHYADTNNFKKNVVRFTVRQTKNLVFIGCENAWEEYIQL